MPVNKLFLQNGICIVNKEGSIHPTAYKSRTVLQESLCIFYNFPL